MGLEQSWCLQENPFSVLAPCEFAPIEQEVWFVPQLSMGEKPSSLTLEPGCPHTALGNPSGAATWHLIWGDTQ